MALSRRIYDKAARRIIFPLRILTTKEGEFHACLVVVYDDHTQHFIIRNSWESKWEFKIYFCEHKFLSYRATKVISMCPINV
jgi:C1A family cysteine protease